MITASLNWLRGPIYTQTAEIIARDQRLAERMQSRMSLKNSLCDRIKNEPDLTCRRAADWKKLDAAEIDFPKLDLEYLETITCGSYQIKLAPGYIADHLSEDGEYEISVNNHSEDLIRDQIHSTHKSQAMYYVRIQYDRQDLDNPIKDYFCSCPAGKRTVGMCAHTASIVYFLGYMPHKAFKEPLPKVKKFKSHVFQEIARNCHQ